MKKILEDMLLTGLGAIVETKDKAEELVENMVEQGDVTRKEGKKLLDEFLEKTDKETTKLSDKVSKQLEKKLKQAGFVTKKEVEDLNKRIKELEEQLNELNTDKDSE